MSDFYRNRTVLVTGISGFLGAPLASALSVAGARVIGLDRVTESPCMREYGLNKVVPVVEADVSDGARLLWHFTSNVHFPRPSVVFHLAGMGHIKDSQDNPAGAVSANVLGAANVLEACRALRDQGGDLAGVVVSSSNHTYAGGTRGRGVPFVEIDRLAAVDMYGATKACADHLARAYAASYQLPVVALRHLNAYGPADPHASHLVPATILRLLDGKAPIIKSDGSPIKGYVYVEDLIQAYLAAGEIAAAHPGAYNVGDHTMACSVLEMVRQIIQASGLSLEPEVLALDLSQQGYVEQLHDGAFRRLAGWRPAHTREQGLATTWAWYRNAQGMEWLK